VTFNRKPYVRPPRAPLVLPVPGTAPARATMQVSTLVRPTVLKFVYVRSPALMKAYRLICCQHCGRDDGTVCGAHSNWAVHGKGRSIKASGSSGSSPAAENETAEK
jgi:hypothetical protein